MKAEILTIGDELLRGEIVDSNKSWLSAQLLPLDVETRFHASVTDDPADITDALLRATRRSDVVLVSGGLGPTRDDLTIEVLAETFGRKLVLHEESLALIEAFFERFGRTMAPNNAKQAWFPEGSEVLPNPIGTAPGCLLEVEQTLIFCMPGVPREMRRMLDEQVLPRISARQEGGGVLRSALLRTFGMGESNLDNELADIAQEGQVRLGFRTSFPDNFLRPVVRAATAAEADALLARTCEVIRDRLGVMVYGEGDQPLEAVLGGLLREEGRSLAVAESCTGGRVAEQVSQVPGASDYFRGGVVAYANAAKTALLDVPAALIEEQGAVSEPVARAMAEGVRLRFGSDFGVATTGISGPGGGSEAKPVGLVWIAVSTAGGCSAREFLFPFDRELHRQLTSQVALDWVRRMLLGAPEVAPRYLELRR